MKLARAVHVERDGPGGKPWRFRKAIIATIFAAGLSAAPARAGIGIVAATDTVTEAKAPPAAAKSHQAEKADGQAGKWDAGRRIAGDIVLGLGLAAIVLALQHAAIPKRRPWEPQEDRKD